MHRRAPNNVTRKWFRVPFHQDRLRTYAGLSEFIAELDTTALAVEPPDVVSMEWRAYSYLTHVLETSALPTDRYRNWLQYGAAPALGDCDHVLGAYKLSRARRLAIIEALSNIEAYPSKRPVERHQISRVLQDAGIVPVD